ncbi:MAG: Vitamin B12 dependent methionine synthase activation subunit [Clostridiales bacterium]|nr:Vitamin B12 dependent methionine synthase activation subunit [Clostridiales bacterium]
MPLEVEIPVKEVQRYMGYHGIVDIAPEISEKINKAIEHLGTQSHPRIISKEYRITVAEKTVTLHAENEDVTFESEGLVRNLTGCCGAVLLAATIGPACDMLVRRASITSAADSAVYQAAGAAAIEAFLDDYNDKLKASYEARGLFLRPRFSPGYGDLKLEHQKDWFRLLDITKQIGIELTDSLLMVPTKSVTAIIGIGIDETKTECTGCKGCNRHDTCEFSKERA